MKWTEETKKQLRDLAFAEKSNKEIAKIMGISIEEVWAGRSRFGITIAKVKAMKEQESAKETGYSSTKWTAAKEEYLKELAFDGKSNSEIAEIMEMSLDEILTKRIDNLNKAKTYAQNKIKRCEKLIEKLKKELFEEELLKIARS